VTAFIGRRLRLSGKWLELLKEIAPRGAGGVPLLARADEVIE
jgi:hypothetical protein